MWPSQHVSPTTSSWRRARWRSSSSFFDTAGMMEACTKDITKNDRLVRHKIFYWLFALGPKSPLESHDLNDLAAMLHVRLRAVGNTMGNLKMAGTQVDWAACGCYYFTTEEPPQAEADAPEQPTDPVASADEPAAAPPSAPPVPQYTHICHRLSGCKAMRVEGGGRRGTTLAQGLWNYVWRALAHSVGRRGTLGKGLQAPPTQFATCRLWISPAVVVLSCHVVVVCALLAPSLAPLATRRRSCR